MHFDPARFFRCTVRWLRASDVTVQEGTSRDGATLDLCMFHSVLQESDESKLGNCPGAFQAVWWPGSCHCLKMNWLKRGNAHEHRSGMGIPSRQVKPKEATGCFSRVCTASTMKWVETSACRRWQYFSFFKKSRFFQEIFYLKLLNQVSQITRNLSTANITNIVNINRPENSQRQACYHYY